MNKIIGWYYEMAHGINSDYSYKDFRSHISFRKPNVPDGSIRNLTALAAVPAEPTQPSAPPWCMTRDATCADSDGPCPACKADAAERAEPKQTYSWRDGAGNAGTLEAPSTLRLDGVPTQTLREADVRALLRRCRDAVAVLHPYRISECRDRLIADLDAALASHTAPRQEPRRGEPWGIIDDPEALAMEERAAPDAVEATGREPEWSDDPLAHTMLALQNALFREGRYDEANTVLAAGTRLWPAVPARPPEPDVPFTNHSKEK